MYTVYQKTQSMKTKLMTKIAKYHEAKKQRGMTLLEIIIVLGIIGTIAAGVVVLAQRAFDSRTISDVVSNTNTVRVAMKDAYQRASEYPVSAGAALTYDIDSIKTGKEPVAVLVQLGKVSIDEARNAISNDFLNIGGAKLGDKQDGKNKGFFIELNGLSQTQCRSILGQVGNQWDYVEIATAGSGAYSKTASFDLTVEPKDGILRSLNEKGNVNLEPAAITAVCTDTPDNSVILGSR